MMTILLILGCTPEEKDSAEPVNLAPIVEWTEPTTRWVVGQDVVLTVSITDTDGINEALVYHRQQGSSYWERATLEPAEGDLWTATLSNVSMPGLEFYFKAEDLGSPIATTLYPSNGPSQPLSLTVYPESRPLPFAESFELAEGQQTLRDIDWWTPSETRDTYQWLLNESHSHTGQNSVYHLRGSEGMPELRDWLISPPLDFSTEDAIMVGWWENGLAVDLLEEHSLWVSTGSRLPDDGDFQRVEILDTPISNQWSRHRYVDLSEFAGEELVYLGWRWSGSNNDEWSIDDVEVRALAPDLAVEVTAPNASVGQEATVSLIIENLTVGSAESCDTVVLFPEAISPSQAFELEWNIEGNETLLQQFGAQVDSSCNPHRRLPVEVQISCGEEEWTFADTIQIGQPSLAQATIELTERSQVSATVGYGDPTAPTWETLLSQQILDAGVHTLSVDVTDQFEALPPEAGVERWFLHLESSGVAIVQNFTVGYGTTVVGSASTEVSLPDFPVTIQVPPPPVFEVVSVTPTNAQPGDQNLPVSITIGNLGASTQGAVLASMLNTASDVTVLDTQIGMVDVDSWQSNETHTISTSIDISPGHTSSTPVQLTVLLADSVESWLVPVDVEVPFPRLGITGVIVDDTAGNNDGRLDPNESAQLEIQISNSGGQSANGVVYGELSLEASSTADATIVNDNPSFGFVTTGAQKDDDDFFITVNGGSNGDHLDLLLSMQDNTHNFEDRVQLVLGEAPWIGVSPLPDAVSDSLDVSALDLESVEYRVNGTMIEIRIASATVIDPTTTFIEAWGRSAGGGYAYYRWVLQSGVGTLQGYISGVGFQPLGTLSVDFPDDHHVVWTFDSDDLDLALTQFDIGFASGWCGPPEYYCDHYPDGWGYPYVSFNMSQWFEIEW
jgi:hypothetical protein